MRYEASRAAASNLIGGQAERAGLHARRDRGDQPRRAHAAERRPQPRPAVGSSSITAISFRGSSPVTRSTSCPITADGRIDLDAAEAMLTEEHRVVAFAHVSNVLGSILDAKRAAEIAHSKGALLLLDGCQAVPRLPVDVAAIGCDFYAYSGHKIYGPTGIGCLWGRARPAAANAAVAGRRIDDRSRHFRRDDLSSTRRCGSRRERRTSSARSGCTPRSTGSRSSRSMRSTRTNARWSPSAARRFAASAA